MTLNGGEGKDERKLNRVLQLTGFSDPVYAEAGHHVHYHSSLTGSLTLDPSDSTHTVVVVMKRTRGDAVFFFF